MPTLAKQLENAKARAEIARLKISERVDATRLARLDGVKMSASGNWDVADSAGSKRRKQPVREKKHEDKLITKNEDLKSVAAARSLQRNAATFVTLMRQFEICVPGSDGPKLQLNTSDPSFNSAAQKWFNSDYAKWCDGTDDTPLAEMIGLAVIASKREGDCLFVFDDFDRNDGTIRVFEHDQLTTVNAGDWATAQEVAKGKIKDFPWQELDADGKTWIPFAQHRGIVRDRRGRVVAYVVTPEHGKETVPLADATILPAHHWRHNPTGSAKLYKRKWRFDQGRGTGDAAVIANQQRDMYEMLAAEVQTGKKAAQDAGWTEVDPEAESAVERAMLAAGIDPDKVLDSAVDDGDASNTATPTTDLQYESLEAMTGGNWTYSLAGEKQHRFENNRPGPNIQTFGDWNQAMCGAAMGLGQSRALLRAAKAYTAFRGEELMSWAAFYWDQKSVERRLMDWLAFKAVGYAIQTGEIDVRPPKNWWKSASFDWPKMPEVDPLKTAQAQRISLKNGSTDFSKIWGPDWEEHLSLLAEMVDFCRAKNLPLSILETISGSVIEDDDEPENTGDDDK